MPSSTYYSTPPAYNHAPAEYNHGLSEYNFTPQAYNRVSPKDIPSVYVYVIAQTLIR